MGLEMKYMTMGMDEYSLCPIQFYIAEYCGCMWAPVAGKCSSAKYVLIIPHNSGIHNLQLLTYI